MIARRSVDKRQVSNGGDWLQARPGWAIDIGVGCLLVSAFVIFIAEPLPVDPMIYLEAAQDPLASELNHWTARLLVLIPASVASLLFGFSEVSLYVIPLFFVFILGAATSALGRLVAGDAAGPAAAIIAASGPIVLPYGTQLLPDVGGAALLTASLAFLFRASKGDSRSRQRDSVLAGVLFGCAYLVRETSLIFTPAYLVAAWILDIRDKRLALMVLGTLFAPLIEISAGWILWNEPFPRLEALAGRGRPTAELRPQNVVSAEAQATFVDSFGIFVDQLWRSLYGRILVIGGAAFALMAAVKRDRRYLALTAWVLVAWSGFAAVGTVGFSGRLIIRLLLERYWAFLMPALAVAAVAALASIVGKVARRLGHKSVLAGLATLVVVGVGVLGAVASFDARGDWFMRFGNDGYWQLRSSLASVPRGAEIHVEDDLTDLIRLYTVDPLGQPTTQVEIVEMGTGDSADEPEWLLISTSDVESDSSTLGSGDFRVSNEHAVFAAERERPRWVLLTTRPDLERDTRSILEVGGGGVDWRARRVTSGKWGEPFPLSDEAVAVAAGDQLVVFDDSAAYGEKNSASPVKPGALIEFRAQLPSVDGVIEVLCRFHSETHPEDRRDVPAISVLEGGERGGRLTAFCRAPASGQQTMRPVLVVSGPSTLQIGDARVSVHAAEG